jgi:hypothetical protein
MPDLKGNLEVIDMGAAGGFDEGIIALNGKVGFRAYGEAEFEACHGVKIGFNAGAAADATADAKLLWLIKGAAEGNASASLSLRAGAIADLNIFNILGLEAKVYASAEAAAAGKISIGITPDIIAEFGRNAIKEDFLYDIFIAFLNETSIGVGLWGKASAGIGANAFLSIKGSLIDNEKSGFEIDFGADYALAVGAGYGMFGGLKFENPKRFFLYASERISREVVERVRPLVDEAFYPYLEMLQFAFPTVMNMAFELAQSQIKKPLSPEEITKLILDVSLSQLQRFLLDKIVEGGIKLLTEAIEKQIDDFIANNHLPVDKDKAKVAIEQLIIILRTDGITHDNLNEIIDLSIDLFDASGLASDEHKVAIAIIWLAFNTVDAIRNGVENASGSAGISNSFGLAKKVGGDVFIRLQSAPEMVKEEISRVSGFSIAEIESGLNTSMAIDYLLKTELIADLIDRVPYLEQLLGAMEIYLQLSPGEIVEAAFKINWEEDVTFTDNLFTGLSGLIKALVNDYIHDILIQEIRNRAGDNEDLVKYIDDTISPALEIISSFVFDKVTYYIDPRPKPPDFIAEDFFDDSFFNALTKIVSKIFTSNVIVVAEILINHTLETMHVSMKEMAAAMGKEPDHILVKTSVELFDKLLPPWMDRASDEVSLACKELAISMCLAASDVSGPLVFTYERKERLSRLYKTMFASLDPKQDSTAVKDWDAIFKGVSECFYIPDKDAAIELVSLQLEIINDSLLVMLPQVTDALIKFNLSLTKATVDLIENLIRELFADIDKLLANLKEGLNAVRKELDKAILNYENALNDSADIFEALANQIKNDTAARDKFFADLAKLSPTGTIDAVTKSIIEIALNLLVDSLFTGAQITRTTAALPAYILSLVDLFFKDTIALLPPEFTLEAIENEILNYLNSFSNQLETAIAAKQAEIEAERIKNGKQTEKEFRKEELAKIEEANELPELKMIEVAFASPVPFIKNGKPLDWTYGKELPVKVEFYNAKTIHINTKPQSIFIAINGHDYSFEPLEWKPSPNGKHLTFETILSTQFHPLKQGINVIECTVIQHDDTVTRATVEFMMNPELASDCTVIFDFEKSIINAGGDDHENTRNEFVAFTNTGNMPADMSGWILSDRKNHLFIFPEYTLMPHETVRVFTGPGINESHSLFQGKKRAIWNNKGGETVFLINKDRVLVLNQIY